MKWFAISVIAIGFLGWWALKEMAENQREFDAYIVTEREACLAKKESAYMCETYVNSIKSRRAAEAAETMATISLINSTSAIAVSGGKAR